MLVTEGFDVGGRVTGSTCESEMCSGTTRGFGVVGGEGFDVVCVCCDLQTPLEAAFFLRRPVADLFM